ncbi:MAG: DUF2975 domain-containing protein, partial [Lutibacter sp.]|nr:DUF2975 domain-containing protein [Lutibacter sp.]
NIYISILQKFIMRKLIILKLIVDLFWILSLPTIPLILIFIPYSFITADFNYFPFKINGAEIEVFDLGTKIILTVMLLSYLLLIYCIYLFRKVLGCFVRVKIFDEMVVNNFKKIGNLLVLSSILIGVPSFFYKIYYMQKISLELGISPFIFLLCLGFFFIILSEIFKISRNMKEENDLTI